MNKECQVKLSFVARDYLAVFYCILDQMERAMTAAELNDSISHNFIVQMIPHHQAAIDMSRNLLRHTTRVPLQDIAQGIITEQAKSIENMLAAEESCSCLKNEARDLMLYQRRLPDAAAAAGHERGLLKRSISAHISLSHSYIAYE